MWQVLVYFKFLRPLSSTVISENDFISLDLGHLLISSLNDALIKIISRRISVYMECCLTTSASNKPLLMSVEMCSTQKSR